MPGDYSRVIQSSIREHTQYLLHAMPAGTPEGMIEDVVTRRWRDQPGSVVAAGMQAARDAASAIAGWRRQGYDERVRPSVLTVDPSQSSTYRFVVRVWCYDERTERTDYRYVVYETDSRPTRGEVEDFATDWIVSRQGDPTYGRMPTIQAERQFCGSEVVSGTRNR